MDIPRIRTVYKSVNKTTDNIINNAFTRGLKATADTIASTGKAINYIKRSLPYALTLGGALLTTLGFSGGARIAAGGAAALRRARTENVQTA